MERSRLPLHKREELRRKEDAEATKVVYQEFLESFQDDVSAGGKAFVRGEVVQHGAGHSSVKTSASSGKMYKPEPMFKPTPSAGPGLDDVAAKARLIAEEKARKIMMEAQGKASPVSLVRMPTPLQQKPGAPRSKPRSNLEAFKEELKAMQDARDERRKVRAELKERYGNDTQTIDRLAPSLDNPYTAGSYDHDPYTTNMFLSNLSPEVKLEEIYELFGAYGPLASAKILWPRNDEERERNYNCGFVAFMTRADADRAVSGLRGTMVKGHEMKMSFAKPVTIPMTPVYIPPSMSELMVPPPPSGLPFNAQPTEDDLKDFKDANGSLPLPGQPAPDESPEQTAAWHKMLKNSTIRVVIPTDRQLLGLIHRTIEFVIREGPMFEALMMSRELNNPIFRFLFDNQCPAHTYYLWKLYSILHGDTPQRWREEEFRMFEGGSKWKPPPVNLFSGGMPKELYIENLNKTEMEAVSRTPSPRRSRSTSPTRSRSGSPRSRSRSPSERFTSAKTAPGCARLSDRRRDQLEDLLRQLTPERVSVTEAMVFCVENADCSSEIVECILESLSIDETPLHKKIARLYLVSDILSNCAAKVANVTFYRKFFALNLETIFTEVGKAYARISSRIKAEQFKQRVMQCFRIWEDTNIYPTEYLIKLQNIFLGLVMEGLEQKAAKEDGALSMESDEDDIDGQPLETPAALRSLVADYDIDGAPIDDEEAGASSAASDAQPAAAADEPSSKPKTPPPPKAKGGFVKSKWEELDPETVEKQAVTTSKWDEFGRADGSGSDGSDGESARERDRSTGLVPDYDDGQCTEDDDDLDGVPMDDSASASHNRPGSRGEGSVGVVKSTQQDEQKRQALRDVEVRVMNYQDDLEAGIERLPKGKSIAAAVADLRASLLKKLDKQQPAARSPSPRHSSSSSSAKKKSASKDKDKDKPSRERDRKRRSRSRSSERRSSRKRGSEERSSRSSHKRSRR